jgi:hypothetical protein
MKRKKRGLRQRIKSRIKQFAKVSLLVAGLALLPRCSPPPENISDNYLPAYKTQNGKISQVTLRYSEDGMKEMANERFFSSPNEIPSEKIEEEKSNLAKGINWSRSFIKDTVFEMIEENNFYSLEVDLSRYGDNVAGVYDYAPYGFVLMEPNRMIDCLYECPEIDLIRVRKSEDNQHTILHELFHDAWYTYLNEEEKREFEDKAKLFYSVSGSTRKVDLLFEKMWFGFKRKNGTVIDKFDTSLEVMYWWIDLNDNKYSLYPLIDNILTYIRIRSRINRWMNHYPKRNDAIYIEGFADIGSGYYVDIRSRIKRIIPTFMVPIYKFVMNEKELEKMLEKRPGFFSNEEKFRQLIPYIESFVDYMKKRYPELKELDGK